MAKNEFWRSWRKYRHNPKFHWKRQLKCWKIEQSLFSADGIQKVPVREWTSVTTVQGLLSDSVRQDYDKTVADGWVPGEHCSASKIFAKKATIIEVLLSDAGQIEVWPTIQEASDSWKGTLLLSRFRNHHKERNVIPPKDVDVVMVARRVPYVTAQHVPSGTWFELQLRYLPGCTGKAHRTCHRPWRRHRLRLSRDYIQKETYSDLTGERGTLMGAIQGLLLAQFETLRSHGHSPSGSFQQKRLRNWLSHSARCSATGMDWMHASCSP